MKNVIVTSYSFHGNATGSPLPTEQVSLGYTDIEWNYVILDPETGDKKGNVPAKYNPAKGKS
jgi:type VI secretion system secreted protein Hcp